MSISFVSDLHYESNKFVDLKNIDNSDVLILCGDIITGNKENNTLYVSWFNRLKTQWKYVIHVNGNHEAYNTSKFNEGMSSIIIANIHFVYGPLWTDLTPIDCIDLNDPKRNIQTSHLNMRERVNKFARYATEQHDISKQYIINYVNEHPDNTIIIATHFPPIEECSNEFDHPYFINHDTYNFSNVPYWIYGHTHINKKDFKKNNTKYVCNQCSNIVKTINL